MSRDEGSILRDILGGHEALPDAPWDPYVAGRRGFGELLAARRAARPAAGGEAPDPDGPGRCGLTSPDPAGQSPRDA